MTIGVWIGLHGDADVCRFWRYGFFAHELATPSTLNEVKTCEGRTYELLRNSLLDSVTLADPKP
jgi:hypothetical protein